MVLWRFCVYTLVKSVSHRYRVWSLLNTEWKWPQRQLVTNNVESISEATDSTQSRKSTKNVLYIWKILKWRLSLLLIWCVCVKTQCGDYEIIFCACVCAFIYHVSVHVLICSLEGACNFIARQLIATLEVSNHWGWDRNEVAIYWFNSQEFTSQLQDTVFMHRCAWGRQKARVRSTLSFMCWCILYLKGDYKRVCIDLSKHMQ